MHRVYRAEHLIDAHLVRGRLESEGVEAFVTGDYLTGAMGELPVCELLAVWVDSTDLVRAKGLLAQWRDEPNAEACWIDDPLVVAV